MSVFAIQSSSKTYPSVQHALGTLATQEKENSKKRGKNSGDEGCWKTGAVKRDTRDHPLLHFFLFAF